MAPTCWPDSPMTLRTHTMHLDTGEDDLPNLKSSLVVYSPSWAPPLWPSRLLNILWIGGLLSSLVWWSLVYITFHTYVQLKAYHI